jgi:capsular polysaccharide biosynthesis protein
VELRYYISVLRRRWLPLVAIPALAALFVVVQIATTEPSYISSAQLTVTRVPQQVDLEEFRYNEYYLFLSSEFLVDDLVEVVRGNVFANDVQRRVLDEFGVDVPAHEVQMAIESNRRHRILEIDVTHQDEDLAIMVAQAAARQLNEDATRYFGFDAEERGALVQPVQFPEMASSEMLRLQIFWALQLVIAAFGGLLAAVLLEYLDDRMYSAEMVEHALALDVVAEVPGGGRGG